MVAMVGANGGGHGDGHGGGNVAPGASSFRRAGVGLEGPVCEGEPPLGWPGGEDEVTKKKIQIIFLPLMVLGNESQKEF